MNTAVAERIEPQAIELSPTVVTDTTAIIQMVERAAANPAVDIDKMERLLMMQERVMDRRAKATFDAAFAEMQPSLPIIDRNGKIVIEKGGQIVQSTAFADIADINEAVMPIISRYGFGLSHRCGTTPEGKLNVTAILSHRDGHREETTMTLQHDATGSKNAVQAVGSSMTYGRRYTTIMLLNFTSRAPSDRDDDGAKSSAPGTITQEQLDALRSEIVHAGADIPLFLRFFKISALEEMPSSRFDEAMSRLAEKERRAKQ